MTSIISTITYLIVIFVIMIFAFKNQKNIKEAQKRSDEGLEKQKESVALLKEIRDLLKKS